MTNEMDNVRESLTEFMRGRGLTVNSWASVAQIAESALRNFLSKRTDSMNLRSLLKLARAEGIDAYVSDLLPPDWVRPQSVGQSIDQGLLRSLLQKAIKGSLEAEGRVDADTVSFIVSSFFAESLETGNTQFSDAEIVRFAKHFVHKKEGGQ